LLQRLVIKTKSVEYMPFLLSLAVFLCGTSWFVYGLLGRDPFVAVSTLVLEDPAVPCDRCFYFLMPLSTTTRIKQLPLV
jgi:hypothetical protein